MDPFSNVSEQGRAAVDKAANTAHSGIDRAGDMLSDGVESARTGAKSAVGKLSDQARTATKTIRDTASQTSESIISYTRDNPARALMIAAGCGALVLTLIKALRPSRE